jgi:type IV pilus assembly protein PilC
MPVFEFEAVDPQGQTRKGEVTAPTEGDVHAKLSSKGLSPIKISQKASVAGVGGVPSKARVRRWGGRVSQKQLTQITTQFSTLQDAGLPIVKSLKILAGQLKKGALAATLQQVAEDVEGGMSLSEAMEKHPRCFDILYTNMVRAGEAGGVLDVILRRLAEFMEKAQRLKRKIVGASIYPIAVITIAVVILGGIMIFVIPSFQKIFEDLGKELPALTQMLLNTSEFVSSAQFWFVVPPIVIGIVLAWILIGRSESGKHMQDRLKLSLPVFGSILKKSLVARFARTLGTLVRSGVPILEALDIVKGSIGNLVLQYAIAKVHGSIREGETIAQPLSECGIFDDIVVNMIGVGEETGELDTMLLKVADNFDEQVDVAVESMVSLLEPMLIVGMGVAVGFIVISLFLPLVNLIQNL